MGYGEVALADRIIGLALGQGFGVTPGFLVGGQGCLRVAFGDQHVAQHGAGAVTCSSRSLAIAQRQLTAERGLGGFEPVGPQIQEAEQHLRLPIVGGQLGCACIGPHRILRAVDEREGAELAPIGGLATVELALAFAVEPLAQHVLGLAAAAVSIEQHRPGGCLEVGLEGCRGPECRRRRRTVGERCLGLHQARAQLLLQLMNAPLQPNRPSPSRAAAPKAMDGAREQSSEHDTRDGQCARIVRGDPAQRRKPMAPHCFEQICDAHPSPAPPIRIS